MILALQFGAAILIVRYAAAIASHSSRPSAARAGRPRSPSVQLLGRRR